MSARWTGYRKMPGSVTLAPAQGIFLYVISDLKQFVLVAQNVVMISSLPQLGPERLPVCLIEVVGIRFKPLYDLGQGVAPILSRQIQQQMNMDRHEDITVHSDAGIHGGNG